MPYAWHHFIRRTFRDIVSSIYIDANEYQMAMQKLLTKERVLWIPLH